MEYATLSEGLRVMAEEVEQLETQLKDALAQIDAFAQEVARRNKHLYNAWETVNTAIRQERDDAVEELRRLRERLQVPGTPMDLRGKIEKQAAEIDRLERRIDGRDPGET